MNEHRIYTYIIYINIRTYYSIVWIEMRIFLTLLGILDRPHIYCTYRHIGRTTVCSTYLYIYISSVYISAWHIYRHVTIYIVSWLNSLIDSHQTICWDSFVFARLAGDITSCFHRNWCHVSCGSLGQFRIWPLPASSPWIINHFDTFGELWPETLFFVWRLYPKQPRRVSIFMQGPCPIWW